ncbi:hypothetical protein KM043_015941 [Ampulex compressa]|nr:hypothetical protein KM043_015941 [Ampulex compressa]
MSMGVDGKVPSVSDKRILNICHKIEPISSKVAQNERPKQRISKESDHGETSGRRNTDDIRIICNPLSTPYPYSTSCHKVVSEMVPEPSEEEPKGHTCGSFLPILSFLPQTVISFQYLSPKMKFSWWRNKIS